MRSSLLIVTLTVALAACSSEAAATALTISLRFMGSVLTMFHIRMSKVTVVFEF